MVIPKNNPLRLPGLLRPEPGRPLGYTLHGLGGAAGGGLGGVGGIKVGNG